MHLLKVALKILVGSILLQFIMHAFTEGSREDMGRFDFYLQFIMHSFTEGSSEDIGRFHFTPVHYACIY